MPPKRRTTRATPATTTAPTTTVTDAQLQALIDQGVAAALAECDASRSRDGDNSHGSGTGRRRQVPTQRECTYTDFLKCQPMNFKGTEGVVGLTQWVEKMESVFLISNCAITSQVKYASCTLQGSALTWWNSHVRAVGQDVAYTMPWTALKRMITDKYCPRGEIKKLESEYWNLKVRGTDLMTYNQRFQELALMCDRMFPEESAKVERYVGGLPDMIHGSVKASKPQSMQEAIEFATEMMDKKMLTAAERQAENKRKGTTKINNNHSKQIMWHGLTLLGLEIRSLMEESNLYVPSAIITTMGHVLKSALTAKRLVTRPVTVKFDLLLTTITTTTTTITRGPKGQITYISLAFSSLIDIIPTTLDHGYDVELADGRIIWVHTLIRGCTLNFLNHPFNIDLMPVKMGSFDVIIGMDWLAKYHAVIVCDEKLVHVPFENKILTFHGGGSNDGHELRLNIISCTKTGDVFVARVPYRLALSEIKELSDQLKELSDKGFIRPTSLPWGASILFFKK
ncbi:putative reverse transcriptase domain-containing protein, partial [Tanacetum coccineum]